MSLPENTSQSDAPNDQKELRFMSMGSWAKFPNGLQFGYLWAIILVSATVFSLIGAVLSSVIFGFSILDNPDIIGVLDEPNVMPAMKTMQILQHLGLFIVPALLFAYLVSDGPRKYLQLDRTAKLTSYLVSIAIMFLAFPLINWMIMVNESMVLPDFLSGLEAWMQESEEGAAIITEKFLRMDSVGDLILNLTMIAIIPAIGEELLFRGVIQRILINWTRNVHLGIWIAAILFSALHMQFYGFLPRMMLGVLFGYLFVWSGSLLLPMLCHLINNGTAVIYAYVEGVDGLTTQEGDLGTSQDDTMITIACALAIAGLLYLVYRKEKADEIPT